MGIFKGTVARRKVDVVSHPADAIMLQAMAARGELGSETRWVHHLFFRDKATALEAAERAEAAGWSIDWLDAQPEPFVGWVMRAGRNTVIDAESVSIARDFFEGVAGATHGKYDGWDVRPVPKHSRRRLEVPVAT
jgi:hypothetical protein